MADTPTYEQLCIKINNLGTQLGSCLDHGVYKDIFEDLPFFICKCLPDSTITFVNRAFCKYYQKNKKDLLGKSFLELIPVKDHKTIHNSLEILTRGNPSIIHEHEMVTPSGIRQTRWTIQAFFDDSGVIKEFQSTGQDITEEKKDRYSLKNATIHLEQFVDFLPDATFAIDLNGKVIVWNKAMEMLTGVKAADILEKGDYEYALPIYGKRRPALIDLILKPDAGLEKRYPYVKKDNDTLFTEVEFAFPSGREVCLWVKTSPIYDHNGAIIGAIESIRDIIEIKKIKTVLEETQRRLEQLIEFLPDPTFAIDSKGSVIAWNKAMETLTGVKAIEILGKGDYEYAYALYGKRRHMLADLIFEPDKRIEKTYIYLKKQGDVVTAEGYISHPSRYIWAKAGPIYNNDGNIVGAIESLRDITEQKKAETEIRASEKRYRDIFENVSDFLYVHDLGGKLIETNLAFKEEYGYSNDDLASLTIKDLIPDRFKYQYDEYMTRVSNNGRDEGMMHIKTKDGSIRTIEYKNSLVFDERGIAASIRGSARDITEREQTEHALRESEERYRLLAENIRDVIWVLDLDLNYTYISPSVKRLRGYETQEVMKQRLEDILTPESYRMAVDIFLHELEQERSGKAHDEFWSRTFDLEMIRKDGSIVWTEATANFMYDKKGGVSHIIGVTRDITERKQAKKALKQSDERFRKMADSSPIVFWMVSPDRKSVIYASPAYEKIFGHTCESLYKKPSLWFEVLHRDDREYVLHLSCDQHDLDCEYRIIRPDGCVRWIHERTSPIYDENDEVIILSGIMEDITDHKKAEEEKKIFEARLNRAQKMEAIGTLAGGIAHDFNNILSAIIGYTELSLDNIHDTSMLHANLEEVLKAGDRAKDLVGQILTFSRQVDIERRPVRIHLIVKEVLKLLRSSIPSTIKIIQKIDPASGSALANPTQIHQVIMNLCTNAYQAMVDKGGELRVSLTPEYIDSRFRTSHQNLAEGTYIKLSVNDTGCGIDSTIIERIFDPFFTTKDKTKGTGLGLATVHGIVMELGGDITVSSIPQKGSCFDVYLPRQESNIKEIKFGQETIPTGNNEHLLLIDDEVAILQLGKDMLEQIGYKVSVASASPAALEMFTLAPERYDLVITDQTMPDMTGDRLASEMLILRADLPIILMTGYSETITSQKAMDLGISHFIEKPFSQVELCKTIFDALQGKKQDSKIDTYIS